MAEMRPLGPGGYRCDHGPSVGASWTDKCSTVVELPAKRSPKRSTIWHSRPTMHVACLYPELLSMIFSYLDVPDKGRVAQVCQSWKEACYRRSVWQGVEAKLHLKKSAQVNALVLQSLVRRGIKKIQILSLQRTLKDLTTKELQELQLESLVLTGCFGLTDDRLLAAFGPDSRSLQSQLTHLDLSMCKNISDRSIVRIAEHLTNLESLDLGGCTNLSNVSLSAIESGLSRLRRLNLRSCKNITDAGIAQLCGQNSPERQPVQQQQQQQEGSLVNWADDQGRVEEPSNIDQQQQKKRRLDSLESLILQDCQKLTDDALKHISAGLRNLKSLNLSFCSNIFEYGLKHLSTLPQLQELNLRSCDNVTDLALRYLSEGCAQLRLLDISFCDKVGDAGLTFVAQGLPQLTSLSLNSCSVTDDGLIKIAQSLTDLKTLNIGQCSKITDKALNAVSEHCLKLTHIDLYGCPNITTVGIERITQLPQLDQYNLNLWVSAEWPAQQQQQQQKSSQVQHHHHQTLSSQHHHHHAFLPHTHILYPTHDKLCHSLTLQHFGYHHLHYF